MDRDDVERVSLERHKRVHHHPHWITERESTRILGVTGKGVFYRRRSGRLPVVENRGRY